MEFNKFRSEKGVAGLTLLLSLITMLFVIGLLVMVFALMGGELADSDSLSASESLSTTQNGVTLSDAGATLTTCNSANQGTLTSITVVNASGGETIASANYTYSVCTLTGVGTTNYNGTTVNTSYSITYAGTSWDVINSTTTGISHVTDWYDIFVVIGAMVVLILLTIIIIVAIRGSGLMAGGTSQGGNIGSA